MITTLGIRLLLLAQASAEVSSRLNIQGGIIMFISVGSVVLMTFYCIYRVLQLPPTEIDDIKGPLEIDTGDTQDSD